MPFDLFSILVLALFAILLALVSRLEQRTRRAEMRLRALLKHFNLPDAAHPTPSAEAIALLQQPNGVVAATKKYRSESGLGLKESHDVIAAIKSSLPDGSGS